MNNSRRLSEYRIARELGEVVVNSKHRSFLYQSARARLVRVTTSFGWNSSATLQQRSYPGR